MMLKFLEPDVGVQRFEELLPLRKLEVEDVRQQIGQAARLLFVQRGHVGVFGQVGVQIDDLLEERQHRPHQRLARHIVAFIFVERHTADAQIRFGVDQLDDADALDALHQHGGAAVGHPQHAADIHRCAYRVKIRERGVGQLRVALRHDQQRPLHGLGGLNRPDRTVTADEQGRDQVREDHGIVQRQHRVLVAL